MIGPSLFFCLNFFFLMAVITWTAIHLAQHYNYSPQKPGITFQQGQLSKTVSSRSTTPRKMEEGFHGETESTIEKVEPNTKLSTTLKPLTTLKTRTILQSSTTTSKPSAISTSSTSPESFLSLELSSSQKPGDLSTTLKSTSTTSSSSTEKKPLPSNDGTGENIVAYFEVESSDGTSKTIIASGNAQYDKNNVLIIDPDNKQTTQDDLSYLLSTNDTAVNIKNSKN